MTTEILPEAAEQSVLEVIPTCQQCGTTEEWGSSSWCPKCGYYPVLGEHAGVVRHDIEEDQDEEIEFPYWMIVLGIGVLALIGASLVARFAISNEAGSRTLWSLSQLGLGFLGLMVAQIVAGLTAAFKSPEFSPLDIVMKPLAVWKSCVDKLPEKAWIIYLGGWSLTAVMGAVVIIGSIPYSAVFDDWGFKKRAEVNLVQEIVSQARTNRGEGEEDLEGAMKDFVGKAEGEIEEEPVPEEVVQRENADCVVMGYTKLDGEIDRLHLATMFKSKLTYVGSIKFSTLPASEQSGLRERMLHYRQSSPITKANVARATWLKPVIMCRISYEKQGKKGMMEKIEFSEMMADLQ